MSERCQHCGGRVGRCERDDGATVVCAETGKQVHQFPWLVLVIYDHGVPEVHPFADEADARRLYDYKRIQWTSVYLTEVKEGPG